MTLLELQTLLGNQLKLITDGSLTPRQRSEEIENSKAIVSLSKQMINNADVILRADKLLHECSSENITISKII